MSGGSCYTVDAEIENLLETDPFAAHERIMQMTRPQPVIVYKEYTARQPFDDNSGNGSELPPMSTDEMIDAMAQALAQTRDDLRAEFQGMLDSAMAPWTEAVAVLQAQMNIVLSLIANNNNSNGNGNNARSIEASDEIKTARRVRVRRTSESTT
jgi:hypothetical protein